MSQATIDTSVTDAQKRYLVRLKYSGPEPKDKKEASQIIDKILHNKVDPPHEPATIRSEDFVEATPEELKAAEHTINVADKYERLAISRIKKRGAPLRGDVVHAERMYLIHVQDLLNAVRNS